MGELRKVMIPGIVDQDGHVVAVLRYPDGRIGTVDNEGHSIWSDPEELDGMVSVVTESEPELAEVYEAMADIARRYPERLSDFP